MINIPLLCLPKADPPLADKEGLGEVDHEVFRFDCFVFNLMCFHISRLCFRRFS